MQREAHQLQAAHRVLGQRSVEHVGLGVELRDQALDQRSAGTGQRIEHVIFSRCLRQQRERFPVLRGEGQQGSTILLGPPVVEQDLAPAHVGCGGDRLYRVGPLGLLAPDRGPAQGDPARLAHHVRGEEKVVARGQRAR